MIALFLPSILAAAFERDERIAGGSPAPLGKYPFHVAFLDNGRDEFCGGSIILASYVLTAAHCNPSERFPGLTYMFGQTRVLAGSVNYKDHRNAQVRSLSEFVNHPKYVPSELADIAIVKVSQPFIFNANVGRVALNDKLNVPIHVHPSMTAIGWGATSQGSQKDFLQEVVLNLLPIHECTIYSYKPADVFCTAKVKGKGVCSGDSGGAIGILFKEIFVQHGIASYIYGSCGDARAYFTDVAKYINWMSETVNALSSKP